MKNSSGMKKNIVQDVRPPVRSIRNIELPSKAKRVKEDLAGEEYAREVNLNKQAPIRIISAPEEPVSTQKEEASSYKYEYEEPIKPRRKILYVALGLLVLAIAFAISAFFKSAEIRIAPKEEAKALSATFTAKKSATKDELGFQLVTLSKEVDKTVPATTEQNVEKKAQGRIIIYNNTSLAQKLVATTRFETPEGLIFRVINPITIPAKEIVAGKSVAGSVEATVEADKPGTSYNIPLKDFTVPGFKGDSKYTLIYARSKNPMTGGFSGMQKVVGKETMDVAQSELESLLRSTLSKDISSQIPENFVLYVDGLSYEFDPVTQVVSTEKDAVLRKKGTVNAIIFDKNILSKSILEEVLPDVTIDMIRISNIDKLSFVLDSPTIFDSQNTLSIGFSLKGDAKIVWIFDENKLKSELLGLSKTNARSVISTYSAIKEAWITTKPFWNQTIPNNPSKVNIVNTSK